MRGGDGRIGLLLEVLDGAFTAHGWQGQTLTGALRGLAPLDLLWRPAPGRHTIWEIALHTAYWKHVVRQRILAAQRKEAGEPFPRAPRNYPRPPARADAAAWKVDLALVKRTHARLVETVRALPGARLRARVGRSSWVVEEQIFGIAAHDLYHTGQIQLVKALARGRRN